MKVVSSQSVLQLQPLQHLPFLYCTRTVLRLHPYYHKTVHGQSKFSTTPPQSREFDGVSSHEAYYKKLNTPEKRANYLEEKLKRQAETRAAFESRKGGNSTITAKERQVFKDIFNDIAAGSVQKKLRKSDALETPQRERGPLVDDREIFAIFSNALLDDEIRSVPKRAAAPRSGAQQGITANERQQAGPTLSEQDREHIQKYPARLRKIASRATLLAKAAHPHGVPDSSQRGLKAPPLVQQQFNGTENPESDFLAAESSFSTTSDVEKATIDLISAEQMHRISGLLLQAAEIDDKKLWTTCEESVFTLLNFLADDPSRSTTTTPDSLPKEGESAPFLTETGKQMERTSKPFALPSTTPPLPILSTLYPALLLLTLRLLTTHYPLSPYQSLLLPHLRSLGLRSYVLGTSTPLYNTLLAHRWDVYSDLAGMDALLREMERGGVEFDSETVAVLEGVRGTWVEETKSKSGKGKGDVGMGRKRDRAWWESEVTKRWLEELVGAGGWRVRIMESLREKSGGGEKAIVEREYAGSVSGDGDEEVREDDRERQTVWL